MSLSNILQTGLSYKEYIIIGGTAVIATALVFIKHHLSSARCQVTRDLTGKVVLITRGSVGVGKETAKELAKLNATVIITAHEAKHAEHAIEEIKAATNNQKVEFMKLDLTCLTSIDEFVKEFKAKYSRLDILINNAMIAPQKLRSITKDGYESQLGANHIGPFYLTKLLLDEIKAAQPSRVLNVSSKAQLNGKIRWDDIMFTKDYNVAAAYAQSKLANVMFTKELQRRMDLEKVDVKAVCVYPGIVRTNLKEHPHYHLKFRHYMIYYLTFPINYLLTRNAYEGAQTTLHCALEDHKKLKAGGYYSNCKEDENVNPLVLENGAGARLWKLTDELLASR